MDIDDQIEDTFVDEPQWYIVCVTETYTTDHYVNVQADSPEDAQEQAIDELSNIDIEMDDLLYEGSNAIVFAGPFEDEPEQVIEDGDTDAE